MNVDAFKARIPWQAKIAAKLLLSRLPFGYGIWQRLELFKHGYMERPEYAYRTFRLHFDRSGFAAKSKGFVCLELGPGDTLFSALIARSFGATKTYLVDTGAYCRTDPGIYRRMASYLAEQGHDRLYEEACGVDGIMEKCGGAYLTEGLASLRKIPTASVDWIWSQAVLEHVRKKDFLPMMRELRRVLKPDGVCSHGVDLQDHLGGALNNLRFDETTWESEWMSSSGFYTNRIRFGDMGTLFREAGFTVDVVAVNRWQCLPTPVSRLVAPFAALPEEDLLVKGFDVLLRPSAEHGDAWA